MKYAANKQTQNVAVTGVKRVGRDDVADILRQEATRLAQIKEAAARPFGAGSAIVDIAPARGPVEQFQPRETVQRNGKTIVQRSGYRGQDALRRSDAFDVMEVQAQRRAKVGGKLPKGYRPLFTTGQLVAARDYTALAERVAASGVRCSSIEAMSGGAGGQGSWIDAVLADGRLLASVRDRVGDVDVLAPANTRGRRGIIRAQALVDQVCIAGMTISAVLAQHGWGRGQASAHAVMYGLRAALDRMQGFTR